MKPDKDKNLKAFGAGMGTLPKEEQKELEETAL